MARRARLAGLIVLLACAPALADSLPAARTRASTSLDAAGPGGAIAPAGQAQRLQRLAALAALWGEVRYFHPYLATRDIDWDRALIETIPRVEAATTPSQYRAAIDHLLGFLHDPSTHTSAPAAPTPAAVGGAPAELGAPEAAILRRDGIVRIDFTRLAEIAGRGGSQMATQAALAPAIAAMAGAQAVVLDARGRGPATGNYYSARMLASLLKARSNAPLLLGALRYRQYYGYESQTGSFSSGGYHSGLGTDRPLLLPGQGDAPLPPMVLLVNANSALPGETLTGLQATGRVRVLAEGDADFGASPIDFDLGEGLRAQVRSTELLAPDGVPGFRADVVTDAAGMERAVRAALADLRAPDARRSASRRVPAPASQRGDLDRPYAEMAFPSREYRLLALFRVWNVMDKFFPYRDLIGPGWDDLLPRYVPKFEANATAVDYQLTLRQLAAELHDSHAALNGAMLSAESLGRYLPPAMPRFLEGQTVIATVFDEGAGLRVGDTVLSVDGRPIAELRERMAGYTSGSTPQALMRDVHRSLFRGQKDSPIVFGVRGFDGRAREVALTRSVYAEDPRLAAFEFRPRSTPVFGLLPGNVGYVDLARLVPSEVDAMFAAIAAAPATIFDMRGYPNGTAWPIAPRLTTRKNPVAALFRAPVPDGRSRADPELRDAAQLTSQRLPDADGAPYLGRVVMLVDEGTQSQAESTALFFEAATDVRFVGTPSAGANGDVTQLVLPGAIAMQFSGHDVRHADGRQLQRLGIQPHLRVAPTIGGLVRGEDEVLAAALRLLEAKN